MTDVIYATRGLIDTLLRMAEEAGPDSVTISVAVTQASELPETDLPPETPVFTHFYMPSAGGSVNAVFGVDLGTPVGQTQGRFVSHPDGNLSLTKEDDLHEVVFVAVPPWEEASLAAFDRRGDQQELELLDAEPPEEVLE
ncbi:hypothetical protein SAMN05216559_2941 [Halomicrobium zhouii]|uniref:Proteasome lid subunit RPN8/RPN11, contains Jab1/MPN metalloenzyme (JAMM) motif n=1 Tax=Halomicrobium zhouii TaxID=767519 RepID=A0A1I6LRL0_9EURY|nr:hypothetical protein SAMN05216559_2941 [Halomicrobium zhouii]